MIEEWRAVVGQEGKYEVSDLGRVRSVTYVVTKSNGIAMTVKGRIRRLKLDRGGYPRISFNGKGRDGIVHQMVLAAFVGECPEGMEVRHSDGDSENACLANLSYATHAENMRDMWKHGTAPIGEKSGTAKLKQQQVKEIIEIGMSRSLTDIAKEYGVSFQHVSRIRNGHRWRHLHEQTGAVVAA